MKHKRERKVGFLQYIIFGVILIYLVFLLISQQSTLANTQNQHNAIQEKLALEERENEKLKEELEIVNTDTFYEKIAREVFGYVKKGEKVYVDNE